MLTSSQAGLIVYSSEPFLITPITDVQLVENLLPEISRDIMPENGDRPDRAINLAVEKLQNAGYREGNIVIFAPDAGQGFDKPWKPHKTPANAITLSIPSTSAPFRQKN